MTLNKKLLLVEDDFVTAAAETATLKKNGFDVFTASSGEKAIEMASSRDFDMILMDIDLGPGISGSETAEIILQTKTIPIVFLTSHSEKSMVEKVRSITRYGYVIKNSGDFVLLSSISMAFELFDNFLKIKESERKYRNLYHYGHVGLFETDLKTATIITCNQRYCDMAGFKSVDEAIGQDLLHLYADPQDREEIKRIIRDRGFISDHVIRLRNQKTGKIFWGEFSARLDAERDIAEGTIIDITNLKTAEEELKEKNEKLSALNKELESTNDELHSAMEELESTNEDLLTTNSQLMQHQLDLKIIESELRESEDLYRQLFEAESDAIFLIENEHGNIIEANNAAAVLYGYTRDELLQMKNTDLSSEPEETQNVTHGTPVISENVITIPLRLHKKKDGSILLVEITGRFFHWHGKPVHIAAIRNITGRINDQNALKEKSNELELFFTVALDLFCIADTDGNFIRVNKSWEKILGYKSENLEKRKFIEFVHPDDSKKTLKAIELLIENKPVLNFVNRYRCYDGTYRYLEWQSYPYGKLIYAAARDITERKQTEDRIQSLLQEKEILLREVHHRIKNNMYTISNLLFLQSEILTDQSAIDALADARNRVQSMMLIYDKLYRSSDYTNIPIKDYLNNLIDEIASIFPDSGRITVEKYIEDFIMNSNTLFNAGIIINEAITNSFKYAFPDKRKGTIKVSAVKTDESNIEISIIDNGIGFSNSKKTDECAGFGLELIKILAEQINAEIEFSGESGTNFKMKLPL